MTFLTPFILGLLGLSAIIGIVYIGITAYDLIRKTYSDYHRDLLQNNMWRMFHASWLIAVILMVLELFL